MLPYWYFPQFNIGPVPINTWGFVVSFGFAAAILVAYRRARRMGLDGNKILDLAFWVIVASIIGARFGHVFFYEWNYFSAHLREIVRIDQGGLSSFGGFVGALFAFLLYGRRKGLSFGIPKDSPSSIWRYADILMFVWPLGHGLGRIGCFLTHMHPGRLSTVPWAVQYPDGARLDMGLIESIILLFYWLIILLILDRRWHFNGIYVVAGMIFYGALRFVLDFFRAADIPMSDARYFGLTPAQYGSVALILIGLYLLLWRKKFFLSH